MCVYIYIYIKNYIPGQVLCLTLWAFRGLNSKNGPSLDLFGKKIKKHKGVQKKSKKNVE